MKKLLSVLLAFVALQLNAQNLEYYKEIVKELSSSKYQGRGYAKDGANKAGDYLAREFSELGADRVIRQEFTLDINTFPGKMELSADGKKLTPGVDFSMREYSPGAHGEYPVYHVDTLHFDPDQMYADLAKPENANCLVACEFWFTYRHGKDFSRLHKAESPNAGFIYTWPAPIKFFKAYGERVVEKPIIWMTPEAVEGVKTVRADIDNRLLEG